MAGSQPNMSPLPSGSWDTHIHVTDPSTYPLPASGSKIYKVETATLSQALDNAKRLGVPNPVFIQTSTYGTDNTWIIDCLRKVKQEGAGRHARGIVVFDLDDKAIDEEKLREWHDAGVRGIRINLVSVGADTSGEDLRSRVRAFAQRIRPLDGWAVHVYLKLHLVPALLPLFDEQDGPFSPGVNGGPAPVKLVIDHIGAPPGLAAPMAQYEGWEELLRLLLHENCFVKIDAPYRFTRDPEFQDMQAAVRELLKVRGGRAAIFASDWPHTRFEGTDILPWVSRCREWCGEDQALEERLFRSNAERLFGVTS